MLSRSSTSRAATRVFRQLVNHHPFLSLTVTRDRLFVSDALTCYRVSKGTELASTVFTVLSGVLCGTGPLLFEAELEPFTGRVRSSFQATLNRPWPIEHWSI